MNQEELIEQIVDRAAHAVEQRLAAIVPAQAAEAEPAQEPKHDLTYRIDVIGRWRTKTYRVKSHSFETHGYVQNPGTGEFQLVPSIDALVLVLPDDTKLVLPKCRAKSYRIYM